MGRQSGANTDEVGTQVPEVGSVESISTEERSKLLLVSLVDPAVCHLIFEAVRRKIPTSDKMQFR